VFTAGYVAQKFLPAASAQAQWALSLIPFAIVCAILSTILYLTVERPFINWSKGKPVWG
jgi:hypothetical protein